MTEWTTIDHADADSDHVCDLCGEDLTVSTEPTEVPTVPPTEAPTTVPPATEPDAVEEKDGDVMPWVIGGIAVAAVAVITIALILRKKKK